MMRVAFGDYSALGNKPGESSTIASIGGVYKVTGKYTEALAHYEASLKIIREIGNKPGESTVLAYIGRVYHIFGNYTEALVVG